MLVLGKWPLVNANDNPARVMRTWLECWHRGERESAGLIAFLNLPTHPRRWFENDVDLQEYLTATLPFSKKFEFM